MPSIRHMAEQEIGATAVEYAIMAGLIAAVIVTAVQLIGSSVASMFNTAAGWPW